MKVLKLITLLSLLLPNLSCQSKAKKNFEYSLFSNQCSEALVQLPENQDSVKFLNATQEATGTALSYTVTGLGYTSDAVITVVGGAVILVALCGPLTVASVIGNNPTVACLAAPGLKDLKGTHLGKTAFKETTPWRCPNLKSLSQSIEKVADCYSSRGDSDSLKAAAQTLQSLEQSHKFYQCLPETDQHRISQKLDEIKKGLAI